MLHGFIYILAVCCIGSVEVRCVPAAEETAFPMRLGGPEQTQDLESSL